MTDFSTLIGSTVCWHTSSGIGGNRIEGEVLAVIPKGTRADIVMRPLGRKVPKGIVMASDRDRLLVLVKAKNGQPVKGRPLKFPVASSVGEPSAAIDVRDHAMQLREVERRDEVKS